MQKITKFKIYVFIIILCAYLVFVYLSATNCLSNIANNEFEACASNAVYKAMQNQLENEQKFDNLFSIKYNSSDEIVFISTDSFRVNILAQNFADETYKNYKTICDEGISVPLGVFFGVPIVSGLGKKINVKIINVISVKSEFVSKFESVGINQTRQTLMLSIECDVWIVSLGKNQKKTSKIEVLVYDNLIVGKVPQTYLTTQIVGKST